MGKTRIAQSPVYQLVGPSFAYWHGISKALRRSVASCALQIKRINSLVPRKTVLLVDDDASVREALSRVLTLDGYEVHSACSIEDGARIAAEVAPDVALLDLNLAGESGLDLIERMHCSRPTTPIIIITARPDKYRSTAGAGCHKVMCKPLDLPLLLATVTNLIAEGEAQRSIGTKHKNVRPTCETRKADSTLDQEKAGHESRLAIHQREQGIYDTA